MKILLINQPLNNRGDESAHKALIRSLLQRIPNCNIKVLFINSTPQVFIDAIAIKDDRVEYVNFHHRYKGAAFLMRTLLKCNLYRLFNIHPDVRNISNIYKEADYIICCPGGICLGGFQDWNHLAMLYIAKNLNKKLIYFGRSFGPFKSDSIISQRFKALSLNVLRYSSFLSIRDKKTQKIAADYGLPYKPTVDTAFLETPRVELPSQVIESIGNDYIVYVPNSLVWHYNYCNRVDRNVVLSVFVRISNYLLEQYSNCRIVMLPQVFNELTKKGDYLFFDEIRQLVNNDRIVLIDDCYNSDVQQTIISKAKCVVGARYHSIVFAINNQVPFVALSYEHKILGLLESIGRLDAMIDICNAFDNEENIELFFKDFQQKINSLQLNSDATQNAKTIAKKCFDDFVNFLNDGAAGTC